MIGGMGQRYRHTIYKVVSQHRKSMRFKTLVISPYASDPNYDGDKKYENIDNSYIGYSNIVWINNVYDEKSARCIK